MQQYAGVCLLQNYSTCFGCLSHPSSVVHQNVTAVTAGGRFLLWHYDLYQKLQLQFDVLLMMGAIDTWNV